MAKNDKGWQGGEGPWGKPKQSGPERERPTPPNPGPDFERLFKKSQDSLRDRFGKGPADNRKTALLVVFSLALLWLASGFYIVQTGEQGVVMRFGKFHRITLPGPNYHLPYPFETVETPNVETISRILIGDSDAKGAAQAQNLVLTTDENIIDLTFEVQWKIKNAEDYLFNVRNPEGTIRAVAESAMREAIGRTSMANELSQMREGLMSETRERMQETLDFYKAGVEVVAVNIKELTPPSEVIDAFYDVQRAKSDQERARNEAESYSNDILPRARGEASQIVQRAEAYRQEVVARATGDASRFTAIYEQYLQAKDVTKKRMYLETMEQVLKGMDKVVIDNKGGPGAVPVLPLPALGSLAPAPAATKPEGTAK